MRNLVVTPRARDQLAALPEVAVRAVDEILARLLELPRMGLPLGSLDDQGELFRKLVIVRRHWTLHIVYRVLAAELIVEFVDPSWVKRASVGDD